MSWVLWLSLALNIVLIVLVIWIITYSRRMVRRAIKIKQKNDKQKMLFMSNIAKALHTPVNTIVDASEVLMTDSQDLLDHAQRHSMASELYHCGQQLRGFLNQLHELSNTVGNVLSFTKVEVNLAELMASYRREALHISKVRVDVKIETPLSPHVRAVINTSLMHELMSSLLTNAAQHTNMGAITIYYEEWMKGLRVIISDTGTGIDDATKKMIIDMLSNKDILLPETYSLNGLGLTICKSIIMSMEGTLSLESELGKGTTVTIWIPCRVNKKDSFR